MTQEVIDALKEAAAKAGDVAKSFSQPGNQLSGHQYIDLEGPAKLVVTENTPLLNSTPRAVEGFNIQSNWKIVRNITGGDSFFGGVGERQRGLIVESDLQDYFATFKTFGTENEVSQEAVNASKGFDDLLAMANMEAVKVLREKQENAILFGIGSGKGLGQTATPVLTALAGGSLSAGDVSVICVALTPAGMLSSKVSTGVKAELSGTNPNGETITESGGAARKSAAAVVTVSASGKIEAVVEFKKKAGGYAWYAGAAGSEKLVAITAINSVVITALNPAGQLASSLTDADKSESASTFDGLLTLADESLGAVRKVMPTGAAGVGSSWTSDGVGGVVEFEEMLFAMYDATKSSPSKVYMSVKQANKFKKAVLASDNASIHFNAGSAVNVSGGAILMPYLNPLASATGVRFIEIIAHPTIPEGTVLFYTESVPQARGLNVMSRMLLRHDYRHYAWPASRRNYEFGVYVDGVFQHYAPFTLGVLENLA